MDEFVDLVRRSLDPTERARFDRRVEEGAEYLRTELREGALDNADPAIGLELECYAVDEAGRPAPLPEGHFGETPVNRELGRHNVEVNTPPNLLSEAGIEAQAGTIREHLDAARAAASEVDAEIVLDAMWTIPPEEGTHEYLSAVEEMEGYVFAENMYESPRYYAMDNDILRHADGEITVDVPGATLSVPTILVESLATSMQPHLQVPEIESFPAYYDLGIRTLGPVLALTTNSPFLPADCYEGVDPQDLLEGTYHELRVPVFEQSINAGQEQGKVRFPEDIDAPGDVIEEIVADGTIVPFLQEWTEDDRNDGKEDENEEYTDVFWEFDHKHGTYWRWLRGVIGGDYIDEANDERSLRIEYRPVPTQPTATDTVSVQVLVAGLLCGLVAADHPLATLDWEDARESFYDAVENGLAADLAWVTADGEYTRDRGTIYGEVFEYARRGLHEAGVSEETGERHLRPIERRWEERTTPSQWKIERVEDGLAAGKSLDEAIESMQREYIEKAGGETPFAEW